MNKGAFNSIQELKTNSNNLKQIQTQIEFQQGGFQNNLLNSKREYKAVQIRVDNIKNIWFNMENKIEELQEQMRQNNRLVNIFLNLF